MLPIKIKFLTRRLDLKKWYSDFFLGFLSNRLEIILDEENPDYIFHEAHLIDVLSFSGVRIAFAVENIRVDFNISDYGIGFDQLNFKDRYIRFPLYLLYSDSVNKAELRHFEIQNSDLDSLFNRKFCNFLVSNGFASEFRTEFFHRLANYKEVDSGGLYLNTIGHQVMDKHEWQKEYKFSICFENSSTSGYLTEKLIQAYAACTVPIYWGDPDAFGFLSEGKGGINPKAVIQVHQENPEEAIRLILKMDSSPELYFEYLKEPLFLDPDHSKIFTRKLSEFLCSILEQPLEKSFRRGFGLTRMRVENRMKNRSSIYLSLLSFLKNRLKF